jgi:prepilin-type N-terminal cleavage/methylation domain-containing protein
MKKGFTLVELLAVIVILALLALVVTPRVQNAITGAKDSLAERSIDLYGRAALTAVNLYEVKKGVKPKKFSDIEKYIEYNGEKVDCEIKNLNSDGTVFLKDCTVDTEEVSGYTFGNKSICIGVTNEYRTTGNVPQGNFVPGDEYLCEVKPGVEYNFFVVSTQGDNVSLLLDSNISSTGTNKSNAQFGWQMSKLNADGPKDAFDALYNATKTWTNIRDLVVDYIDENKKYGSIKSSGDITTITKKDGTIVATYTNLKARLPMSSEVKVEGQRPLWMVNYMSSNSAYPERSPVSNVTGYWLLASASENSYAARILKQNGTAGWYNTHFDSDKIGIRPVITLKKTDLTQ